MRRRSDDGDGIVPVRTVDLNPRRILRLLVLGVVGLVVLIVVIGALSGLKKTPRDMIGISYGGGPFEGQHFQRIVQPGSNLFENGMFDKLYLYPITQRNYIISKVAGEGDENRVDFIPAPSADRIEVDFEVATYFKLNTSKLQKFHENIGLKYAAYTDEGWIQMLRDSFRQQIEFAVQRESRKYAVADIYANPQTLLDIQSDVGEVLKENVSNVLGDEYFCGPTYIQGSNTCPDFTFVIKRVTIPQNVVQAFQDVRTSEIQVQTKQNEVKQAEFQAQAIKVLNDALKGAGDQYVLLKAIESGKITFWVIPEGQNLTLTTPQGGGP